MTFPSLPVRSDEAQPTTPSAVVFHADAQANDVAEAMVVEPFVAGDLPVMRFVDIVRSDDSDLVPSGGRELRRIVSKNSVIVVAEGDGWLGRFRHDDDFDTFALLAGEDEATLDVVAKEIQTWKRPPQHDRGKVEMTFSHFTSDCIYRQRRKIDAPDWRAVHQNYTSDVQHALDTIVALEPDTVAGRMLLLHGPPGTGKTTLLRTLSRAWASWCDAVYVVDPDQLFTNPGYLHSLLLDEAPDGDRWQLVLLEDCDELVRPDAKNASGQALSRLLNLTDGMVGQGLRVIVCLTTNEPLSSLHPAVTRPGRCLAEVEVGRLSRTEAAAWLGFDPGSVGYDGASLAELFALRNGNSPTRTATPRDDSAYL